MALEPEHRGRALRAESAPEQREDPAHIGAANRPPCQGSPPTTGHRLARVLVVHSSPVARLGLQTLLAQSGRFAVCGETASAAAARELFVRHQPELVVIGLTLLGGDGFGLIKDFGKLDPKAKALVLSKRTDALAVQRAFRAGAGGYLMVGDRTEEILDALDRILRGERYASANISRALVDSFAAGVTKHQGSRVTTLSDRELQVFSLFGRGFGASRLAAELHLSVKTVETHQMRIKEKLGLRNAAELNREAQRWISEVTPGDLALRR